MIPEMVSQTTCPKCSTEVPVHEGFRTWCERCGWNVGDDTSPTDEGLFARQHIRIGERYGRTMLETLKIMPAQNLRPRWTIRKALAVVLAASVHLLSLTLFVAGIYLITTGFPEIPSMLLGAASCAFAWIMRPKPGKVPSDDIASQQEFPALHTLVNEVAPELGGQPINHIIVNEDFNAAYGVVGWRRVPVLWIGLPLWMALRPQERLALLGHEVAHGVNGDGTRSFIVWSALSALDEWIDVLRVPLRHATTSTEILAGYVAWISSVPFAATQSLLAHLLWLDKQQAEYFADYLGSLISGTEAAVSTLQRLRCVEHLDDVLLKNAYSTSQSGAYILGLFRQRIAGLPEREWQRLARSSQHEGARLDASHPPTAYRVAFLDAHRVAEPRMVATASVMTTIDKELNSLQEKLGQRLIARYARD
jgi:heat shock protein HtpX